MMRQIDVAKQSLIYSLCEFDNVHEWKLNLALDKQINLFNDNILIVKPRQTGKTEFLNSYIMSILSSYSNETIIYFAFKPFFAYSNFSDKFKKSNNALLPSIINDKHIEIYFNNGCRIIFKGFNSYDSNSLRGMRFNHVLFDEALFMKDFKKVYNSLKSSLSPKNGNMLAVSSIDGTQNSIEDIKESNLFKII